MANVNDETWLLGDNQDYQWQNSQSQSIFNDNPTFEKDTYCNWTALPQILLTNARSLNNKREYLSDFTKKDGDVKNCDIMFFTNTYLTERSADFKVEGFNELRVDRKKEETGKSKAGGLCALVKNGVKVVRDEAVGDKNFELAHFIHYPDGLKEKSPPLIFILVYITGPDFTKAEKKITKYYTKALEWSNKGPVFLLGSFNKCEFSAFQSNKDIYKYVACFTKEHKILDRCYGNIQNAYISKCKPPLCSQMNESPHNMIILDQANCDHAEVKEFWEQYVYPIHSLSQRHKKV